MNRGSKFVGHSTENIQQSKIKGPLCLNKLGQVWTCLNQFGQVEPIWTSLHQPGGQKSMSIDETYAISKDCRIIGQGQDQYE